MLSCRRCDLIQTMWFRRCILCKLQQEKDMKKQSHLVLHISCVYQRFLHVLHANGVDREPSFLCATTSHSSICKFSITSIRPQDYVTISEPTKSMLHASAACCGSSEQIFNKSSTYYSGCCIHYAIITFSADTVTPQSVCSALHMCCAQKWHGALLQVHGHRGQARSNWLQAASRRQWFRWRLIA